MQRAIALTTHKELSLDACKFLTESASTFAIDLQWAGLIASNPKAAEERAASFKDAYLAKCYNLDVRRKIHAHYVTSTDLLAQLRAFAQSIPEEFKQNAMSSAVSQLNVPDGFLAKIGGLGDALLTRQVRYVSL